MPVAESDYSPKRQALLIGLGIAVAIGALVYLVQQVSPDDSQEVNMEISSDQISLGRLTEQLEVISENGPSLFADLQRGTKSFYLSADPTNPTDLYAFSNIVEGKINPDGSACEVVIDKETLELSDCEGTLYPLTGEGLQQFNVIIQGDNLVVDLNSLS